MLGQGEAYGWIMTAYASEDGEDTIVKMMTTDGVVEYPLASKVDIWAPGADKSSSPDNPAEVVTNIHETRASSAATTYLKSGSFQIRAVKFKTNSSGEITKLYYAVNASDVADENALRLDTTNLNGAASQGSSVRGYD